MATTLTSKPASAVYRYTWPVPVVSGDSVAAFTYSASGCTVDTYEIDGSEVTLVVSGGADGATATITVEADTTDGETITDVLVIPIRAKANALGYTARDVCIFALRPVTGVNREPSAAMQADALEQLNDMLAEWRIDGLDIGIAGVLADATALAIADEYVSALKMNLRVRLWENYNTTIPPRPTWVAAAEIGKRLVSNRLISFSNLEMPSFWQTPKPLAGLTDL